MNPKIATLIRELVEALAREDGVLPEPGTSGVLEWQVTGAATFEVRKDGRVILSASACQATIEAPEGVVV